MPRVDFSNPGTGWIVSDFQATTHMPAWSWEEDNEGLNKGHTFIRASHINDLRQKTDEFRKTFLITGGCTCTCTCECKCTCQCTCKCTCTNTCAWC